MLYQKLAEKISRVQNVIKCYKKIDRTLIFDVMN